MGRARVESRARGIRLSGAIAAPRLPRVGSRLARPGGHLGVPKDTPRACPDTPPNIPGPVAPRAERDSGHLPRLLCRAHRLRLACPQGAGHARRAPAQATGNHSATRGMHTARRGSRWAWRAGAGPASDVRGKRTGRQCKSNRGVAGSHLLSTRSPGLPAKCPCGSSADSGLPPRLAFFPEGLGRVSLPSKSSAPMKSSPSRWRFRLHPAAPAAAAAMLGVTGPPLPSCCGAFARSLAGNRVPVSQL